MDFLLSDDQKQLQDMVSDFCRDEVAAGAEERDRRGEFPTDLYLKLGSRGIPGIWHDPQYGGLGLGMFEGILALEQIARVDQSLGLSMMVSSGSGLTLALFGSEELKQKWLPDIVAGRKVCGVAGTEPQAGSDTSGYKTRARQQSDGSWVINGEKAFITNPGTDITSFVMVTAWTSPPDAARKEFTMFLVPTGTPGLEVGPSYRKMGWRSSDTHPIFFDNCKVGADSVVGEIGQGKAITLKAFQNGRICLASLSLGLAQGCLDISVKYATERLAFGATIGRLQLVQKMVADMAVKVASARMLVYRAAWLADRGQASLQDRAMAKYYATEIGSECANLAIQIHGGWGFMDDCPASRYLRDNRICTIGDGASQIQILLIAKELGLDVKFN